MLRAYADSNWTETRSTTGYCIMLGDATVDAASRRQHCITMSSCEAELVALADCAIALLFIIGVTDFLGLGGEEPINVYTDNKAAHDLCNRFTTAQNSRHVDRKMFKMRELRGASVVRVNHIPTEQNPADLFTKVLGRQLFEKHRATVLGSRAKGWNGSAIVDKFSHPGENGDPRSDRLNAANHEENVLPILKRPVYGEVKAGRNRSGNGGQRSDKGIKWAEEITDSGDSSAATK